MDSTMEAVLEKFASRIESNLASSLSKTQSELDTFKAESSRIIQELVTANKALQQKLEELLLSRTASPISSGPPSPSLPTNVGDGFTFPRVDRRANVAPRLNHAAPSSNGGYSTTSSASFISAASSYDSLTEEEKQDLGMRSIIFRIPAGSAPLTAKTIAETTRRASHEFQKFTGRFADFVSHHAIESIQPIASRRHDVALDTYRVIFKAEDSHQRFRAFKLRYYLKQVPADGGPAWSLQDDITEHQRRSRHEHFGEAFSILREAGYITFFERLSLFAKRDSSSPKIIITSLTHARTLVTPDMDTEENTAIGSPTRPTSNAGMPVIQPVDMIAPPSSKRAHTLPQQGSSQDFNPPSALAPSSPALDGRESPQTIVAHLDQPPAASSGMEH
jgi:hypothetical protein